MTNIADFRTTFPADVLREWRFRRESPLVANARATLDGVRNIATKVASEFDVARAMLDGIDIGVELLAALRGGDVKTISELGVMSASGAVGLASIICHAESVARKLESESLPATAHYVRESLQDVKALAGKAFRQARIRCDFPAEVVREICAAPDGVAIEAHEKCAAALTNHEAANVRDIVITQQAIAFASRPDVKKCCPAVAAYVLQLVMEDSE
jgi:hypothetical protein